MEKKDIEVIVLILAGLIFLAGFGYAAYLRGRRKARVVHDPVKIIPYQLCPKCHGQGIVSKPPYIAGDVFEWSSSTAAHQCDVCSGQKIIVQHFVEPAS